MSKPRKHDKQIRELRDKGLTGKEIAKIVGVHPATVWESLKLSEDDNKKIAIFNKDLPNHLTRLVGKITQQLSEADLTKVSPYQLAGMMALLIDKQRLLTGQSTSNQSVFFHLVGESCKTKSIDAEVVDGENVEGGGS